MPTNHVSLVIGCEGMLGTALSSRLSSMGKTVLGTTPLETNVAPSQILLRLPDDAASFTVPPDVTTAFLLAAITSIEACERDPMSTRAVNVDSITQIASTLHDAGAFSVFPSTSLVFGGTIPFPSPLTRTSPSVQYAIQKADAERHMSTLFPHAAVVRLAKVVSKDMLLFRNWASSLLAEQPISPFEDMPFSPISVDTATNALSRIADIKLAGYHHISPDEDITYTDAAYLLADALNASDSLIQPISCLSLPNPPASVPRFAAMDSGSIWSRLDMPKPSAEDELTEVFSQLAKELHTHDDY